MQELHRPQESLLRDPWHMIFQPFLQLLDEGLTAHKAACPIFGQHKMLQRASLVAQMVKKLPAMQETYV